MLKKILAAVAALALSTGFVVAAGVASADAAVASSVAPQCVVDVIHHPEVQEVDSYRYKQTTTIYTIEHKQVKYDGTTANVITWLNSHGTSVGGGVWTLSDQTVNDAGVNPLAPGIFYDGPFSSAHTVNLTAYGYNGGGNSTVEYTITGIDISTTPPAGSFVKSSSPVTIYYVHGGSPTATLGSSNWTTDVNPAGWTFVDSRVDVTHQSAYDEYVYGACPTVVPNIPVVKDLCGTADDHYGLPTGPTGISYTRNGLDVIATITAASTYWGSLPTGWVSNTSTTATYAFSSNLFTDVPCSVSVTPVFPTQSGPTCDVAGSALPSLPTDQTGITFSWAPDGLTMVATADSGYFFPVNTVTTQLYTTPAPAIGYQNTDANAPCYQLVPVVPSATSTDQICSAITNHLENGSITVGIETGVGYEITNDADPTQALIPYAPLTGETAALSPGSYTVHPVAEAGYMLSPSTDIHLTIAPYGDFCLQLITHPLVDPSSVQVQIGCSTAGSYTLSSDQVDPTAVVWTVNLSTVSQGTYSVAAAGHYVIDAAPGPGYGFAFDATTHWVYDFAPPTTCDLKTLALTGSTPDGMVVLAGFLVLFGLALTRRSVQLRKTARN
ncbi:MAG TPA: hypothetical protein VGM38_02195 [Pseudolysinimonas sp.]